VTTAANQLPWETDNFECGVSGVNMSGKKEYAKPEPGAVIKCLEAISKPKYDPNYISQVSCSPKRKCLRLLEISV